MPSHSCSAILLMKSLSQFGIREWGNSQRIEVVYEAKLWRLWLLWKVTLDFATCVKRLLLFVVVIAAWEVCAECDVEVHDKIPLHDRQFFNPLGCFQPIPPTVGSNADGTSLVMTSVLVCPFFFWYFLIAKTESLFSSWDYINYHLISLL